MISINYGTNAKSRAMVRAYLELNRFKRVLDIGYSADGWTNPFVTFAVDVIPASITSSFGVIQFFGDANEPDVWDLIQQDVEQNGPFDFCVASHVLEDIINPTYVAKKISQYCSAGFVAVPSKFMELTRYIEGAYRGFIHHRYIFNAESNELVGYPKLNFIEHDPRFDSVGEKLDMNNPELQMWWTDQLKVKIVNDNFMGPDVSSVLHYYDGLLV